MKLQLEYASNAFGFISIRDQEGDQDTDIILINRLHDAYVANNRYTQLKRLRKDVIDFAVKQFKPFGSISNYITATLENVKLTPNARRFLLDTLQFINTGKRSIDILGYEYLLIDDLKYNNAIYTPLTNEERMLMKDKGYVSNANDITRWLSQDSGFQDMIWSLRILFGSTPVYDRNGMINNRINNGRIDVII